MTRKRIATTITVIALIAVVAGAFSAQLYERTQFKYNYQYHHKDTVSSFAALNAVTINRTRCLP